MENVILSLYTARASPSVRLSKRLHLDSAVSRTLLAVVSGNMSTCRIKTQLRIHFNENFIKSLWHYTVKLIKVEKQTGNEKLILHTAGVLPVEIRQSPDPSSSSLISSSSCAVASTPGSSLPARMSGHSLVSVSKAVLKNITIIKTKLGQMVCTPKSRETHYYVWNIFTAICCVHTLQAIKKINLNTNQTLLYYNKQKGNENQHLTKV